MYRSGRLEQAASEVVGLSRPARGQVLAGFTIAPYLSSPTPVSPCSQPQHASARSEPQVCDASPPGRQASGSACAQDIRACSEPQAGRLKNPGSRSLGHGPQARHNGTTRRAGNRNSRHDDSANILSAGPFGAATFFTCRHCQAGSKPKTTPAEKGNTVTVRTPVQRTSS